MTALRERMARDYDLESADGVWLALFEEACRAELAVRQLEGIVQSDGLLSTGSKGQARVHPVVVELRQQRAAYARLLLQLGVSDGESQSQRQSRHARKRWDR